MRKRGCQNQYGALRNRGQGPDGENSEGIYGFREQMNYIREELGEDNVMSDAEQFQQELKRG